MNRIVMLTAGQESLCSRDTVLRPMLISETSPRSTATRTLSEVLQNRIMTIASQKMWWLGGRMLPQEPKRLQERSLCSEEKGAVHAAARTLGGQSEAAETCDFRCLGLRGGRSLSNSSTAHSAASGRTGKVKPQSGLPHCGAVATVLSL